MQLNSSLRSILIVYCDYSMANKLTIYYQNARGLRTKTKEFSRNLRMSNYDIIVLTETWLLSSITDSELIDDRYITWRRDRDYAMTRQTLGVGVHMAARKDLHAVSNVDWQSSAEDMGYTVNSRTMLTYKLHIGTIYLCRQNKGNKFYVQLGQYLSS